MRRAFLVVAALAALAVLAALGAAAARGLAYRGDAKPGVTFLGTDLGGRDRAGVEVAVASAANRWLARTVDAAMAAGSAFSFDETTIEPRWRPAPSAYIDEIARLARAPRSAAVELHGVTVVVRASRAGLRLDRDLLLDAVERGAAFVRVPWIEIPPAIADPAARSAASTARAYLDRPIAVDYHGARRGALTPVQLAHAIAIRPRRHRFAVVLDREALARVIRPRLGKWLVRARNAQFAVNGDLVSVVASTPGRDLDPAQVAAAVATAAHGNRVARIELTRRDAELTTAEAQALNIRHKLVSFTTEMGVSSSNRIHNVHLMADYIDGTVIGPGEAFSFNGVVGPRTEERGFLEGQMIVGGLLLPSIGGGVCQTATTLFNDAFELGLPILERHNHSLYISHYPKGRDATVSWGGPDFRFRNDMRSGLLIKSSYTDETLTFTFYGTSEHRRVVATTGSDENPKPPELQYAVDPTAPPGSVKLVQGSGRSGFDVTVHRKVYRADGGVLRSDDFRSRYIPEGPTKIYGPGATPPGPYFVIPPV